MPYLTIVEEKGKIKSPAYAILKDGKEFAYATNMMAARAIKIALEDWWLRNPRPGNV